MGLDANTLPQLSSDALFALECEAQANGWEEIVVMCRDERQRRMTDPNA